MAQPATSFLDLPPELREEIYALHFSAYPEVYITDHISLLDGQDLVPYSSLARASKQINLEYHAALRKHAFFKIYVIVVFARDFDFRAVICFVETLSDTAIHKLSGPNNPELVVDMDISSTDALHARNLRIGSRSWKTGD